MSEDVDWLHCIALLHWPHLAESVMEWSGVRPSVCRVGILTVTTRGSMRRGQRTFRSDNNMDRVTNMLVYYADVYDFTGSTNNFVILASLITLRRLTSIVRTHIQTLRHTHTEPIILSGPQNVKFGDSSCIECGAVAQRVERWTCDQQVVGSNPNRGKSCVTTLGKLFTPMCLCHQAV